MTGTVGITSQLGSELIPISGVAVVHRETPHMEGAIEVQDMEIGDLDLAGDSLIGDLTISESPSIPSPGELRAGQPAPDTYPATSSFDVYIEAIAPANPDPTITLYNTTPLRLEPAGGALDSWPPHNVTYTADTSPCIALLPDLPMQACITSLSVLLRVQGVGGETELAEMRQGEQAQANEGVITPDEGLFIVVAAIAGGLVVTVAGWYARRHLFD